MRDRSPALVNICRDFLRRWVFKALLASLDFLERSSPIVFCLVWTFCNWNCWRKHRIPLLFLNQIIVSFYCGINRVLQPLTFLLSFRDNREAVRDGVELAFTLDLCVENLDLCLRRLELIWHHRDAFLNLLSGFFKGNFSLVLLLFAKSVQYCFDASSILEECVLLFFGLLNDINTSMQLEWRLA